MCWMVRFHRDSEVSTGHLAQRGSETSAAEGTVAAVTRDSPTSAEECSPLNLERAPCEGSLQAALTSDHNRLVDGCGFSHR
jgi:hypothetical protein